MLKVRSKLLVLFDLWLFSITNRPFAFDTQHSSSSDYANPRALAPLDETSLDEARPVHGKGGRIQGLTAPRIPMKGFPATSPFYRAINGMGVPLSLAPMLAAVPEPAMVPLPPYAPGFYGYNVNVGKPRFEFGEFARPPPHFQYLTRTAFQY